MYALAFIACLVVASSHAYLEEQNLLTALRKDYEDDARPSTRPIDIVEVEAAMTLVQFRDIDEIKGTVEMALWLDTFWNDSRLAWDPTKYGGLKKTTIPSKEIWTVDTVMYTGKGALVHHMGADENILARLRSTGEIVYTYPVNKVIPCVHQDLKGELSCSFEFESFMMPSDIMKWKVRTNTIDTSLLGLELDPRYKIVDTSMRVVKNAYPNGEEWSTIEGKITFKSNKGL
jgi:hypothetical protein